MIATNRLLVINPNTTTAVTALFAAEARRSAPAGTVIDTVTGAFGAAIVSTQAENVIAGHSVLELLAHHGAGYDAVILAISFDTALDAAREVMPCPVIGITAAALESAATYGAPIGLIVFGSVSRPLYDQLLVRRGLADVTAIETIEVGGAGEYLDIAARDEAIVAAALRLSASSVRSIVICGAAIVGIARRLQRRVPVPLLDGAAPAVAAALRAAAAKAIPAPRPRPLSDTIGLSPALAGLLSGHGPAPSTSPHASSVESHRS